ncbi:MAG: TonB-dependent receptor [Bacteroidetes bacterium]|jgi:iron complex outermembrane receptor protein|nr:TonB-dependent receptor [Bacteroidota bacterium]
MSTYFKLFALLVPILFGTTLLSFSQTIEGRVTDSSTGDPLLGATILQQDTDNGAVTGPDGEFQLQLESAAAQQVVLIVRHVGYQQKMVPLSELDNLTTVSIQLEASSFTGSTIFVDDVRVDEYAPVSQSTIERAKIERDNIGQDPIYTLERFTPSILTHSDAGTRFANYGYMRLRGMDQTRINMTLNGIPLNDMIDQGVFFSNFNDFGNSIQSVQVQRGVGTSTHGTASYAGSINFESRNITMDEPSAGVKLTGGAFDSYRLSAEANTGSMNNYGLYSRFSKTGSDGYRDNSGTDSRSFFLSGGYFGSRNIFKVTAFTGFTENELAYTPVPIDQIRERPRTNNLPVHDIDNFGQQFLQLQYGRSVSDQLTLTSSLYYGGAGGDFPVGFNDENGEFVQQNFSLFNDHYGLQSALQYSGDRLEISGGIHTYLFDRVNEETFEPASETIYYRDDSQKSEFSSFLKASIRTGDLELYGDLQLRAVWLDLNPDLSFLADQGVPPSQVSVPTRQWTFLSPKIGATWFLSNRFNIYASFGRSGREPTRQDILGATNINASNLGPVSNTNSVRAEYVNNLETGFRYQSPRFAGKVNGFFMRFTDEISPTGDFIPEGFIQLRENISESSRYGIEAQAQWTLYQKLTLSGNATWMQTNIEEFSPGGSDRVFEDVESILSPDWLLNSTAAYSPAQWLEVSLSGRYMGDAWLELTNNEEFILPSFFVADLGVDASLRENLSLSINVHNITDELYFTNGAPLDTTLDGTPDTPGYIVQPPRHLFAEVEFRF